MIDYCFGSVIYFVNICDRQLLLFCWFNDVLIVSVMFFILLTYVIDNCFCFLIYFDNNCDRLIFRLVYLFC